MAVERERERDCEGQNKRDAGLRSTFNKKMLTAYGENVLGPFGHKLCLLQLKDYSNPILDRLWIPLSQIWEELGK